MRALLLFTLPWAALPLAAQTAVEGRRTFAVARASSAIVVDGHLDEPAWEDATRIPLDWEWFPGDNVRAPVETLCQVTWDESRIYVAFRASDPEPARIRAHLADRDSIPTFVRDDHVGFQLDTFNDERRAFQFRINPLGVQADGIFSELDGIEDFAWDAIWETGARITDGGYVVEVAVPFNQLRFPKGAGVQTWGIDAFRSWPRSVRHRIGSNPRDRDLSCYLCQAHKISGLEGVSPGRNLELNPTLTGLRTERAPAPGEPLETDREEADPGLTARWGITPNLVLSGAVNPDFSQVEADTAQLAVNERFALFFPEKRPFFLEGVDFFATPMNAVFTRTVVDPQVGAKLTGKLGRDLVGVFLTRDRVNNLTLPSNQGSRLATLDRDTDGGVLRYRRDVGSGSTLGALATLREGEGYHNRVFGTDGFVRLGGADTVAFQYLRSDTRYPDGVVADFDQPAGAFSGDAWLLDYQHFARSWRWSGRLERLAPGFRADSGFIPRVDARTFSGSLTRVVRGRGGWLSQLDVGLEALRTEDAAGRLTDQKLGGSLLYSGPLQSQLLLQAAREKTLLGDEVFDRDRFGLDLDLRPGGDLRLSLGVRFGDEIDVVQPRRGRLLRLQPALEYRLGRSVELRLSHDRQQLDRDGRRLFTADLTQGRLVYYLGTRLFLRAIVQYRDVQRDPFLYSVPVPERQRQLFSQLLLSYEINARTVFLLGWTGSRLADPQLDLEPTERSLFLKLGYALVF